MFEQSTAYYSRYLQSDAQAEGLQPSASTARPRAWTLWRAITAGESQVPVAAYGGDPGSPRHVGPLDAPRRAQALLLAGADDRRHRAEAHATRRRRCPPDLLSGRYERRARAAAARVPQDSEARAQRVTYLFEFARRGERGRSTRPRRPAALRWAARDPKEPVDTGHRQHTRRPCAHVLVQVVGPITRSCEKRTTARESTIPSSDADAASTRMR